MKQEHEIQLFSRHVLGRAADRQTCELYVKASAGFDQGTARDKRVLAFALAHPWALAPLDAALALTNPNSLLRQKLLMATAILETRPAYRDAFLTQERSKTYLLTIVFVLARAVARALAGLLLLRFIR